MSQNNEPALRAVLRRPAVEKATGLSRSVIYQLMDEGRFPACFRLSDYGRSVGWFEDEIIRFQEERAAEQRAGRKRGLSPVQAKSKRRQAAEAVIDAAQ